MSDVPAFLLLVAFVCACVVALCFYAIKKVFEDARK